MVKLVKLNGAVINVAHVELVTTKSNRKPGALKSQERAGAVEIGGRVLIVPEGDTRSVIAAMEEMEREQRDARVTQEAILAELIAISGRRA